MRPLRADLKHPEGSDPDEKRGKMKRPDELTREIEALRNRLSRLSQASLHINESLDFDTVLQGVLDSACSLTGARYGVITLLDEAGQPVDFLSSGMTPEEDQGLWDVPDGWRFFEYFCGIPEPIRLQDLRKHIKSQGLPEFHWPVAVSSPLSFLVAPVHHRGERVGIIWLAETEAGRAFTSEDEETLVMFASQAALVIANARRYQDEKKARTDLETLINTSPVGVVVFDAQTRCPCVIQSRGRKNRQQSADAGRFSGRSSQHSNLPPRRRTRGYP